MATILMACLLSVSQVENLGSPTEFSPPPQRWRPVAELVAEIDQLVKRDAAAKTDSDRAAVAFEMTERFRELKRDPRVKRSDSLAAAKQRLWVRLTRIRREIEARMERAGRNEELLTDAEVLALADHEIVAQSMADHLLLAGAAQGGPSYLVGQASAGPGGLGARGGAAGPPDYGPELVDLIQRTIMPDFWDVAGGPGTIVYYRPWMCLVVRATSDVHHRVGGVVGALSK